MGHVVVVRAGPYHRERDVPRFGDEVVIASSLIATEKISASAMDEVLPGRRVYSDTKRNRWYFRPSPEGDKILFGARPRAWAKIIEEAASSLRGALMQVVSQLKSVRVSHC
ncbi:hypothetical protein [Caballeronia ptereochthonis]|uniref:hypothetical protein n=1 Tax=Caballeronia ptereochthonis TaxID=1777144 RepID=UPI001358D250